MTSFVSQQNRSSGLFQKIVPFLASLMGTIIILFPSNPVNMSLPSRDSGVFLYIGWRMLMGDVPYRDVWDHKPPLVYFVDAIGLAITPNSLWGVWALQFIFIFITLFFLYRALHEQFGIPSALVGIVVLTSGLLTVIENGNVTEEYALTFQLLCIWLCIKAWKNNFPLSASFWIGFCGGWAFNAKQTTIGLWLVYGLLLIIVRLRQRIFPWKDVLSLFAGWIIPTLFFVLYLMSQNALVDFWQQAFAYNFTYIGKHEGWRRLIPVFAKGFFLLSNGWILYLSIAGWLAGLAYCWLKRKEIFDPSRSLILIGLIGLPLEVLLITTSGRSIIHYYLTPMPVIGIVVGTAAYTIPFLVGRIAQFRSPNTQKWLPSVFLLAVLTGQTGQVQSYPEYIRTMAKNEYADVIQYVSKNTDPADKVLLIGAESVVNFLARRESPTRYVYQYPLALTGSRPMFEEYFNQILANQPTLIIDTRGRASLTEKLYVPLQKRSETVRTGVEYLGKNYEKIAQYGEWVIYQKISVP